jgi:hypothetical protein
MITSSKEKEEIKKACDRLFLSRYNILFYKFLVTLDDSTKHLIKNNKKLNEMYDLLLDFIIDSSQHLEYNDAKETARELEEGK